MKNLDGETQEKEVIENPEARDWYNLMRGSDPEINVKNWKSYNSNLEDPTYTLPGM